MRGLRAGILVGLCGVCAAATPPTQVGDALSQAGGADFAQAAAPRTFTFPRDHAAHPAFRQEWWYFTGHLDAATGETFGFELTFFRFALAPPAGGTVAPGGSAWRAREIYMAHFAITDPKGHRFDYSQKVARGALGLAGTQDDPLKVWVDGWSLAAPASTDPAGHWKLRAAHGDYELQLDLGPLGSPVLNGEAGLSVKSSEPGGASYYYSLPRIAATGTLSRAGHSYPVSGVAWFDHEWGSGALGSGQSGWDWFALQLADGSTFMFYALRDRDGAADVHSAGTFVDAAGVVRPLGHADVSIEVKDHWTGAQAVRYPSAWRIQSAALALDLLIRPVLADQELQTTPRYWEGAVEVTGTRDGAPAGGRGYVELVGYGQER